MAQIVDLPLEDGGMLLAQPTAADESSGVLGLASTAEDEVKKVGETFESALAHITPARQAVAGKFLPGGNYSFLATDQLTWFAERLAACKQDGRLLLATIRDYEPRDAAELDAALGAPGLVSLLLSGHPDGPRRLPSGVPVFPVASIAGTGREGGVGRQYQIIATRRADITRHGRFYPGSRWVPDRITPAAGASVQGSQRPMTSAEEAQSLPEDSTTIQAAQAESRHEAALVSPAFMCESPRTGRQQTPRTTSRSKGSPLDTPVPSVGVAAPTGYGSPTADSIATGSSQADAQRWASRPGPGRGVPASSSQTGTFA